MGEPIGRRRHVLRCGNPECPSPSGYSDKWIMDFDVNAVIFTCPWCGSYKVYGFAREVLPELGSISPKGVLPQSNPF